MKTLAETIRHFSDAETCVQFLTQIRWDNGIAVCPHCANDTTYFLATRKIWKCKACKKQFSIKSGTIFEDSALSLDKWLIALWMIANCKNGVSSYELGRAIGVHQRTSWFMLHRLREAMQAGSIEKLGTDKIVEVDEAWVGSAAGNIHHKIREAKGITTGTKKHHTIVLGMLERDGEMRGQVVPDRKLKTLQTVMGENIEQGAVVITDEHHGYNNMESLYSHATVNHSVEYVRYDVIHTQNIENFWSLFKRTVKGTYVCPSPKHLQAYVNEQAFRYNTRKGNDRDRFIQLLGCISGKRLTLAQLVGKKAH